MSENTAGKMHDMTVGSPVKLILHFMVPMFLGNVFQQFYNVADSIIAGQFLGVRAGSDWEYGFPDVLCDRMAERSGQWLCDSGGPVVWRKGI